MSDKTEVTETGLTVIDAEYELRLGDVHLETHRDVLSKASEVARDVAGIIRDRRLFKKIGQKEFVFVEGWTTCGAMLGVAIRPVSCEETPGSDGEFVAMVEAVRASDGFVLGRGIASCGPDEADWRKRSRQARRSMAQTRAAGKAMRLLFSWVMEMAGYAPTPLEEMDGPTAEQHDNPAPADTPVEQPRAKRDKPPEVTRDHCAQVLAHWRIDPENAQSDGDGAAMMRRFYEWAQSQAGRRFDAKNSKSWRMADYKACCTALNIPTLEEQEAM